MNITERIHKLRQEKGWSVARLARESDIPTVSLRAMLARKDPNSWNVRTLMKLAKVLGVSVSYLTAEENENRISISVKERDELLKEFKKVLNNYFKVDEQEED